MNILLINHYVGSPAYGMEYRPYYLAREWVRSGHKVTIVGASYSHLRNRQPEIKQFYEEEFIDGIRYVWLKTPWYQGNGIGRIANMLAFVTNLYQYMDKYILTFVPDVVIASSVYPLDVYPARKIAKKTGACFVFEVHDLWPLSPMELGNMSRYHPFIMVMQMAENYAYSHADKVVSLLPKAKDHMIAHGMKEDKFIYIPNGICMEEWEDIENINESPIISIIESLKKQGHFIIGYAGSHGISNALHALVKAKQQLGEEKIAVIFIGQGSEKAQLQKYVKRNNIFNMYFFPQIKKKELIFLLSMFDALYIGWNKSPLYRFGISPNKIFDYMMAGRPIIHSVTAGNDLILEAQCGISIPAEDTQAIAKAILQMKNYPLEEREAMGRRAREFVLKNHNYSILAKHFINCIALTK